MYRLHLSQNLRSLAFLLTISAILTACGVLWWANRTGLPETWRAVIEREAGKQGAFVKIGALSYIPFRGVVASDVRVFSDASHQQELSRLEGIILDFDKTKLARGTFHLTKVELKDAGLTLPVDPKDPLSETLDVSHADGTILMPGNRRLEIRNAHGMIAGIEVSLNAQLVGYQQGGQQPNDDQDLGKRRKLLARVINELKKWEFDDKEPPKIQIDVEGDANIRSSIIAKVALRAKSIGKNQHLIQNLAAEADLKGDLLTITSLTANDSRGSFEGHVDYDIDSRAGRFDINSSLEIPKLLHAWLGLPLIEAVAVKGRQVFEAEGEFKLNEQNIPDVHFTGHAHCESVSLRGVLFESVETSFSWRDKDLYLRDVELIRTDGKASGKAMIQWPQVRLALRSTFPAKVYRPLFIRQPLEKVIDDFSERKGAAILVNLEGGFDATDKHSWAYSGSGNGQNINYKGVPVNHAECKFSLSHHELDFYDGKVVFNYENYPLRNAFDGPNQATAKIGRIRYDAPSKLVEVEAVTGEIWAAPLVRFFAPKIADSLEQYRFHTPPVMTGSGVVDVTPQGRTDLEVSFDSEKAADYKFLGENLLLAQPSGKVHILGERVTVSELDVTAFGGPVTGRIDYRGKGRLEGEMNWTKIALADMASTYGFQLKGAGTATGRIQFDITDGDVGTMNGEGLTALENAELFSVPMFGPLTPLIGSVLSNRQAGFERAKNAFFTFQIDKGILSTHDLQTFTSSLNFAGEGAVDLKDRTLDMTMRMNARGLLGLITLPLRPFTGLFQFRGTGPLKEAKWENVMFTKPPEEQGNLLLTPPKAKVVNEE